MTVMKDNCVDDCNYDEDNDANDDNAGEDGDTSERASIGMRVRLVGTHVGLRMRLQDVWIRS